MGGDVDHRVEGLTAGGDDYLTKPFAPAELIARIEALGRRGGTETPITTLRVGDLEMNLLARTVVRGEEKIDLQPREFRLLEFLMRNAGQVVTRTMLLEKVWDYLSIRRPTSSTSISLACAARSTRILTDPCCTQFVARDTASRHEAHPTCLHADHHLSSGGGPCGHVPGLYLRTARLSLLFHCRIYALGIRARAEWRSAGPGRGVSGRRNGPAEPDRDRTLLCAWAVFLCASEQRR